MCQRHQPRNNISHQKKIYTGYMMKFGWNWISYQAMLLNVSITGEETLNSFYCHELCWSKCNRHQRSNRYCSLLQKEMVSVAIRMMPEDYPFSSRAFFSVNSHVYWLAWGIKYLLSSSNWREQMQGKWISYWLATSKFYEFRLCLSLEILMILILVCFSWLMLWENICIMYLAQHLKW